MTSRGRPAPAAVARLLVPWLVLLLVGVVVPAPAQAADDDPDLAVRITAITPSRLTQGKTVTVRGTVTNRDDHAWRDVQAYLVISPQPYTSRATLDDAIASGRSYTGSRIVQPLSAIGELGTLRPGGARAFTVSVPYPALGVSGGAGVHPVGIQVLGTDVDGSRSTQAIGRATTFLPSGDAVGPRIPTGLVWPFLMPDRRRSDGTYAAPAQLVRSVTTGRLRNLLDLARTTPAAGSTVLLDPALVTGVDDVLRGRHLPEDFTVDADTRRRLVAFRDDLVAFARTSTLWILGFDRPDVLALSESGATGRRLQATIDRATSSVTSRYSLDGRLVSWPTRAGTTSSLLTSVRRSGEAPVVVARRAVPDWTADDGTVVTRQTANGSVPLLVAAAVADGVPGTRTTTTLRQELLAQATLAGQSRAADRRSRADALVLVDPSWDPGDVTGSRPLQPVFSAGRTTPASGDSLLATSPRRYTGSVPRTTSARALDPTQVSAVDDAVALIDLFADAVPDSTDLEDAWAVEAAATLGVRWREERRAGQARSRALVERAQRELDKVTVAGPPAFTLSSSDGSFPLTISNDTSSTVRVGLRIDSTNPALSVPPPDPVEVGPGERRTVTVPINVGDQKSSTLSAQMVTTSGRELGQPAVFNIRSSRVGTALWAAMGAAGLLVVVAIGRRFLRRRRDVQEDPDDD